MRMILIGAVALTMLLGGCVDLGTLTLEEREEQAVRRDAVIKLTIERIERAAEITIDLSELSEKKLRGLDRACFGAMIGAISLGLAPERQAELSAICDRIAEALMERT